MNTRRSNRILAVVAALGTAAPLLAADHPVPGDRLRVRDAASVAFSSQGTFVLPAPGSADDPTLHGATLRLIDLSTPLSTAIEIPLGATGWQGLGRPLRSKGYRYRSRNDILAGSEECTVSIRSNRIKARCRSSALSFDLPLSGNLAVELTTGSDLRYCAELGGQTRRNTSRRLTRVAAAAPSACIPAPPEPPTGLGSRECLVDQSLILLQLAVAAINVNTSGSIQIDCGDPDTNGQAACTCDVNYFDPVTLLGIGDLCIAPAGPCDAGTVSCNGGEQANVSLETEHRTGAACTSHSTCASQCDTFCAAKGGSFESRRSACEGFCKGGISEDLPCALDTDCPGGECPGRDPAQGGLHPGACNCECLATDIGLPVGTTSYTCELGMAITIETDSNRICGDTLPSITFPPTCTALTTANADGFTTGANDGGAATMPPSGIPLSASGLPVSCQDFSDDNLSGMTLVGHSQVFDTALGDILMRRTLVCE